jgi:hypothetical protein
MSDSEDGFETARLTDKANIIALDASNYPEDRVTRHTTVSRSVLEQSLDLMNSLGWETIDIITADPVDDELPLLALQPPGDTLLAGEQAAITVAPKTEYGRKKAATDGIVPDGQPGETESTAEEIDEDGGRR